jgi:hypothetical protein
VASGAAFEVTAADYGAYVRTALAAALQALIAAYDTREIPARLRRARGGDVGSVRDQ